jgi:hypothetical protein
MLVELQRIPTQKGAAMNLAALMRMSILILMTIASGELLAESGPFYGYIGFAAPYDNPGRVQLIFEKKIFTVKSYQNDEVPKIETQFIAFLKKNHPEFVKDIVKRQTDHTAADNKIRSFIKGAWSFKSEKDALLDYQKQLDHYKSENKKTPSYYLPAIELNDFSYKE